MKVLKSLLLIALMSLGTSAFAQDISKMSDKELSSHYKQQIDGLELELKQIQLDLKQAKLDEKMGKTPSESTSSINSRMKAKKDEIKNIKGKKKAIDTAIKTKEKAEKAAEARK